MLQEKGYDILSEPGGEERRGNTVRNTLQQGKEIVSINLIHKTSLEEGGGANLTHNSVMYIHVIYV